MPKSTVNILNTNTVTIQDPAIRAFLQEEQADKIGSMDERVK
jgi:hypothetical protein